MSIRYVYDSSFESNYRKRLAELLDKLEKRGTQIDRINSSDWGQDQRWKFYLNELMPLSVINKKKLRGRVRTHKSGYISLMDVVLTGGNFFIGEEAVEWLEREVAAWKK